MNVALLLVGLLVACAGQAAARADGGVRGHGSGAGPAAGKRPTAPLQRLQRLVAQAREEVIANQTAAMVRVAREVVKGVVKRADHQQPAPGVAANMLETLSRAAKAAALVPVHRGQLIAERSKLLNALGRTEAAKEAAEAAAEVFRSELSEWAAGPEAGTPANGTASEARQQAAAALGSLLDVAALWRQLGREEVANKVLAEALRIAPLIPSTPNYLRAIAQLSELTDEQLDGALACMAAIEQPGSPVAAPCSWLKLKKKKAADGDGGNASEPVADLHRLYYAAHRGLHARKRHAESWRALEQAKVLHYSKHTYKYRDFEKMVDDTEKLFPSPERFLTAVQEEGASEAPVPNSAPAWSWVQLWNLLASGSARLQRLVADLSGRTWHARGAAPSGGNTAESVDDTEVEDDGNAADATSTGADSDDAEADSRREMIPIFVLGLPRSGSTLAEQILASHPHVYGAGEHSSLRLVTGKLQDMIAGNGTVTRSQLAQLRRRYLNAMRSKIPAEHRGARWMVDKALSNAWLVGHIALMMPQACVVHAVRHPADASLSAFQQSFFPEKVPWSFNLTNVAAHVKAHHRLMAHWDRVLPGRVLHLHYSHMVEAQEATTRRLVDHCGLPWDPAFLRFYETERAVQTASQLQVKKPIYRSSLSKWPAYKEGLAPLLMELRDTILAYEQAAGLPSSREVLDQVQMQLSQQLQQQALLEQDDRPSGQQAVQQDGAGAAVQGTEVAEPADPAEEQDSTGGVVADVEIETGAGAIGGSVEGEVEAGVEEAPGTKDREEL